MCPHIHIGTISTYYLCLLFGILAGWIAYIRTEKKTLYNNQKTPKILLLTKHSFCYFILVACCIQGANYFHYFFDNIPHNIARNLTFMDILLTHPFRTTKVLYGAIFFFPIGIFLCSILNTKENFYPLLNRKAFIIFLVVGFARLGCFFNGCCYGIQSNLFGISFPRTSAAAAEHWRRGLTGGFLPQQSLPVIPTQIISAIIIFIIAYLAWRAAKKQVKHVFFRHLLYYATFRFLIEFIRDDLDRSYWVIFSASQWISIGIFTGFGLCLLLQKAINKDDIPSKQDSHAAQ